MLAVHVTSTLLRSLTLVDHVLTVDTGRACRILSMVNELDDELVEVWAECVSSFLTAHQHILGYLVP